MSPGDLGRIAHDHRHVMPAVERLLDDPLTDHATTADHADAQWLRSARGILRLRATEQRNNAEPSDSREHGLSCL
jgi:hypothetical protein